MSVDGDKENVVCNTMEVIQPEKNSPWEDVELAWGPERCWD